MKPLFPVLAILCLGGCGGTPKTDAADTAPIISDFKAPALQGLKVRDHQKGAQVVERYEGPLGVYEACGVFTMFNGTPVQDAAHFRDLANAAADAAASDPSGELSLSYEVLPSNERRACERKAN